MNLACSIICFWLEGIISWPVRYSYWSILPDDKADIFAASLLISYCSFHRQSDHQLSWFYYIYIYINLKELSDDKVVSLSKKEYSSAVHF